MPIMIARKGDTEHVVPIAGWTPNEILGVALTYEASDYEVRTEVRF